MDWSAEEKLAAVAQARGLSELGLGEFLRGQGLHTDSLVNGSSQSKRGAGVTPGRASTEAEFSGGVKWTQSLGPEARGRKL